MKNNFGCSEFHSDVCLNNQLIDLQDKEFIYRGNECEKLIPFQYRFQEEFSGATVLDHMNVPPNSIKQGPGRCIL